MKQDLMHKDVNDVNITPEERRSIWQLWRQNLKDWAWYIRENPDWLDLDIQTAVKRHVIAPLREGWHRLRSLAHQKKRREFPESENRLAQLLLFAWGSMPRMGAGLRERFALRRRHSIRRSGSIRGLLERLHLHPAIFLGTCVTAAAVIVLLSVYTIGTTVRYDGINLGTVGSRRTVDQAVQQLETVTRQTLEDQDYAIHRPAVHPDPCGPPPGPGEPGGVRREPDGPDRRRHLWLYPVCRRRGRGRHHLRRSH